MYQAPFPIFWTGPGNEASRDMCILLNLSKEGGAEVGLWYSK